MRVARQHSGQPRTRIGRLAKVVGRPDIKFDLCELTLRLGQEQHALGPPLDIRGRQIGARRSDLEWAQTARLLLRLITPGIEKTVAGKKRRQQVQVLTASFAQVGQADRCSGQATGNGVPRACPGQHRYRQPRAGLQYCGERFHAGAPGNVGPGVQGNALPKHIERQSPGVCLRRNAQLPGHPAKIVHGQ